MCGGLLCGAGEWLKKERVGDSGEYEGKGGSENGEGVRV